MKKAAIIEFLQYLENFALMMKNDGVDADTINSIISMELRVFNRKLAV